MLHVRVVSTKGKSRSVQVFRYQNGRRIIVKHIGSGTTEAQLSALEEMARIFIADHTKQTYLFADTQPQSDAVLLSHCDYIGTLLVRRTQGCSASNRLCLVRVYSMI